MVNSKSSRILPKHKPETVKDKKKTVTKFEKIADDVVSMGMKCILALIIKEKLDTAHPSPHIIGSTKEQPGNSGATEHTIDRYEAVWRGLKNFCILIGDYYSAIICCRNICPGDPFPVSVDTARIYLRYKVFKKGTDLTHPDTLAPIIWLHGPKAGSPIKCTGTWTSPSSTCIYSAALAKLHKNNVMTTGNYADPCHQCLLQPIHGCPGHRGSALIRFKGNVVESPKFKACVNDINKYIETNYVLRATYAFLPHQLRVIRTFLISHNKIQYLMLWVMLMFSITEGLRFDELVTLTYEQFLSKYFDIKDSHVDSLVFSVNGKRDVSDINLAVWDDHYCSEFSSVRLILLWVQLNKIQSGFLFPSLEQLHGNFESFTEHYSYANILRDIKYLCYDVIGLIYNDKRIIGTHCGRKTKLLFASWGNFIDRWSKERALRCATVHGLFAPSLLKDLRHKNIQSTLAYLQSSATLGAFKDRHGNNKNDMCHRVGPYNPIFLEDLDTYASMFQQSDLSLGTKSLFEASGWWLFEKIGLDKESFHTVTSTKIPYLIKKITEYTVAECVPLAESDMDLDGLHSFILNPNKTKAEQESATRYVESLQRKRQLEHMSEHNKELGSAMESFNDINIQSDSSTSEGGPTTTKKAKRDINYILYSYEPFHSSWKKEKDKQKKVEILVLAIADHDKQQAATKLIPSSRLKYGLSQRRWYNKALNKVRCVHKCYDNNVLDYWNENLHHFSFEQTHTCMRCQVIADI